jgi:hypothetical protein
MTRRIASGPLSAVVLLLFTGCADWETQWQAPGTATGEWNSIHSPDVTPARFRLDELPGDGQAWRAEVISPTETVVNPSKHIIEGGGRAEGVGPEETADSATVRYEWRTMFDNSYPTDLDDKLAWQVFTQWHQGDSPTVGGSPPIAFTVDSGEMFVAFHSAPATSGGMSTDEGRYSIGPIDRGEWHRFKAEITWSSNNDIGAVKVWHNDKPVELEGGKDVYSGPTLFPGAACREGGPDCAYLKMGLYRKRPNGDPEPKLPTMVVWHDDVKRLVK